MRKAILDGLVPEFSNIPFPGMLPPAHQHQGVGPGAGPQFPPGKQNYNMIQQNKVIVLTLFKWTRESKVVIQKILNDIIVLKR